MNFLDVFLWCVVSVSGELGVIGFGGGNVGLLDYLCFIVMFVIVIIWGCYLRNRL
jgi:hypothetical protein